jgi:hypothetical protein
MRYVVGSGQLCWMESVSVNVVAAYLS